MMMIVQIEAVRVLIDSAKIDCDLTEVLATILLRHFKGTYRDRAELDHADFGEHLGVIDADGVLLDLADIGAAQVLQDAPEVLPVQGPAQALA